MTGANAAKPLLQTPHIALSDGTLCLPSKGVFVPSPLFLGYTVDNSMVASVAGAARLFSSLEETFRISWENGGTPPVTPVKALSTTIAPENFGVTV